MEIERRYEIGCSKQLLLDAVRVAAAKFDGDILLAICYIMADGLAISVGNNLPTEERRKARQAWNENYARGHAQRLRERELNVRS